MSEDEYKVCVERTSFNYPIKRIGQSEEVARYLYLASDMASFVTGTCLPVDGGISVSAPR